MSSHQLIREGRLHLGMTEQAFANAVRVSRGAVQQWEKPGGTAPKRSNQHRVAEVLGISVAELVTGGTNVSPGFDTRAEVPLVSEVEAGNYAVIDNFRPSGPFGTVRVTIPVKRHTYALRVHGDSMASESGDTFPDGSIIIVEPELTAVPGDFVIAVNSADEITFKQLIKDSSEFYLKPLNNRYPIKPLGNAQVIGVIRELSKRFR